MSEKNLFITVTDFTFNVSNLSHIKWSYSGNENILTVDFNLIGGYSYSVMFSEQNLEFRKMYENLIRKNILLPGSHTPPALARFLESNNPIEQEP